MAEVQQATACVSSRPPSEQSSVRYGDGNTSRACVGTVLKRLERPLTPAGDLSCSITLYEPHVYLTGPTHDTGSFDGLDSRAIIRGKLRLGITKSVKIRAVKLKFYGKTHIECPEGKRSVIAAILVNY